jgi:hypothetical protein
MAVNPIQLQRFRRGVDYAVEKPTPMDRARANGAPAHVLDTLDSLSRDHFKSPNDVSETLEGRNRMPSSTAGPWHSVIRPALQCRASWTS